MLVFPCLVVLMVLEILELEFLDMSIRQGLVGRGHVAAYDRWTTKVYLGILRTATVYLGTQKYSSSEIKQM